MAKKRRKKKRPDELEPKGKMRPADGAQGPSDEGTRVDDGARHIFFSFKGELKSDLPDATETDLAANLGLTPESEDDASETEGTDDGIPSTESPEGATADAKASSTEAHEPEADEPESDEPEADEPEADATVGDVTVDDARIEDASVRDATAADATVADEIAPATEPDMESAAETATEHASVARPAPKPDHDSEQEQSRAGPVRGPDPAADQKIASQSRKAAGPAHLTPSAGTPEGASAAAPTSAPSDEESEAATHTDVRGEPFRAPEADATHTEIDAGALVAPEREDDVADDSPTETEFETRVEPPRPPAAPKPGKVASVDDETAARSETILDADAFLPERDKTGTAHESPFGPTTKPVSDTKPPEKPRDITAAGSETILDAEGVRGPAEQTTRTHADAATGTRDEAATRTAPDGGAHAPFTDHDAETETKDPFATASVPAHKTPADATTDPADFAAEASKAKVDFHEADTASQDLEPIANEIVLPPQSPFDLPLDETQVLTEPHGASEAPPAPFAGALFDAPAPAVADEPAPERPAAPRLRRRRTVRKPGEPVIQRLVRWAKRRLDPRDFLEIVGTALFERAQKIGEKVRTARRENRVSHTAEWWRKTLTELAILYAIVIPIELAVSGGRLGSFGIHPHPYWLVVLPLAAARGLVAGLIAAAIASVLYTIGATQVVTDAIFTFRHMTEPLLFFAVAFFAGELHDEGLLKRKKLDRRIDDLEQRTEQLRQQRDVLTDANRELEKRIVDDSVQFGNLIQAARRIERAGRQEIFDLALEMAEEHCGAAASVLIRLEDGSLDYLCHRGWASEDVGRRLALARASAFVQRAVAEGVAVNGLDPSEVAPQEGPLVVAPLFDSGGVVKALMCLDEIPLTRLNESTVTVFLGIADWASAALGRITHGSEAAAPRASALSVGPEVDLWLGTVGELGKRLRIELARCSRYGVATSFLTIQATDWKDATREGIDALDRFVLMHFTTGMRPSDGIYRFGYPGSYLLVLAGTAIKGAEVVRTRLERRVSYAASPVGPIEILATGPDEEAPDLPSLLDRIAKGFRERSRLSLDARCPVTIADRIEAEDLNAFLRRLKMETSLAVRNSFDLHVVGISAEASEDAGPGILARHVVEVGEQTLRPTDGVYMIGQYQCAVILPCTNGEEAATVAHRLATLVRARDPSAPYGQIETQVLGLGPVHPDAGSFLTALAQRGRRNSR